MIKVKKVYVDEDVLREDIEFELDFTEEPQTDRTLKNIKKALTYSVKRNYNVTDKDKLNTIVDKILKIHGLHKDDFDFVNKVGIVINSKLNDVSIDDNSNKNEKTIKGIMKEVESSADKAVGFDYLYRVIVELYGKSEAKRLTGLMFDYSLAISDSTNILIPYCWAMDASKLVTIGKEFGPLKSKPVKRFDSYVSVLNEVIHQMSSHLAGAIAIGTFFLDAAHLLIYKEDRTLEELKSDKVLKKNVQNQFQKVIHGVNSLSRNAVESPFTNISLFDRTKLKTLIGEGNYDWYFPIPKDYTIDKYPEQTWQEYIIEFIMELQKIYMTFFDKGDPSNDGMPYRFPISTVNLSKSKTEDGGWELDDKKFVKEICKKDIYRYNIYASEGTKVASCCRLINNEELLELAGQSNSFGGGSSVSLGSHRVVTLNFARFALQSETLEEFWSILENRIIDTAKILKAHKQLLQLLTDKGLQSFVTHGWIQLNRLFSTFGILGIVECEEILKKKFKKELSSNDLMEEILIFFNAKVNSISKELGISGNIEQIPAESMSHRLPKVDKLLYDHDYNIYANQFIPLWDTKASIWERMSKDGKYNSLLTGGGITHINTGEHITGKQAEQLIAYSVDSGCEHFAITGTFCQCEDGHVYLGDTNTCKCGKAIINKVARTVGFFTPVNDWSAPKIKYDHDKRKEYKNGDFDKNNNN